MVKQFTPGVVRFLMVLALALAVSSLLMTIEWFTWGAWLFVALMLTWKYYLNDAYANNTAGLWRGLFIKLGELNDKIDKHSTRLSTKRTYKKKKPSKKAE